MNYEKEFIIECLTNKRKKRLSYLYYFWRLYETDKEVVNKQISKCLKQPLSEKNFLMLIWLFYKKNIHKVDWKDDMIISSENFFEIKWSITRDLNRREYFILLSYIKNYSCYLNDACIFNNDGEFVFDIESYIDYYEEDILNISMAMHVIAEMEEKQYNKDYDVAYELNLIF